MDSDEGRGDRAGRLPADPDPAGIDAIGRGVRAQPADRCLRVVLGVERCDDALRWQRARPGAGRGNQPVVDRDRHIAVPRVGAGHVCGRPRGLVAAGEAAAVYEHQRGTAGLGVTRGLIEVESQRHRIAVRVGRAAVLDVGGDDVVGKHLVAVAQRRSPRRPRHRTAREQREREQSGDQRRVSALQPSSSSVPHDGDATRRGQGAARLAGGAVGSRERTRTEETHGTRARASRGSAPRPQRARRPASCPSGCPRKSAARAIRRWATRTSIPMPRARMAPGR